MPHCNPWGLRAPENRHGNELAYNAKEITTSVNASKIEIEPAHADERPWLARNPFRLSERASKGDNAIKTPNNN